MPATRITIASNTQQSQRAPLLIPESASDPRAFIFKAAQTKLRLKRPARIFVGGSGEELLSEAGWKNHLHDDVTFLVSAGEAYIGVRRESPQHEDANPSCPVHVLAEKAYCEALSVTQLETAAHTLPGIIHAVGQPDLHPGTKYPIGAVFVSHKWIHPPLIGGDIGCGMAWYRTTLSREQVQGRKGKKIAESLRGLEGAWRTQRERCVWLADEGGSCSAGEEWDVSLGTIGAGNHFAEIQVVEEVDGHDGLLNTGEVVLLVHSGSRGYGGSILRKYASGSHISFEGSSQDAKEYMEEHDRACRWAQANRDLIALRFLSCLEPGEATWDTGRAQSDPADSIDASAIKRARAKLQERRVVDIWHNNVERVQWPPSPPTSMQEGMSNLSIDGEEGKLNDGHAYVHRKGAAPIYEPGSSVLLSILPLPGSRGTPTMILRPLVSGDTSWGRKNAVSLAHGAGRSMSRTKALSSLSQKYKNQKILEPPGSGSGTWVVCDEKDLVYEEAPEAYKDVRAVADDLVREGVAEVVGWCCAKVSYKVRHDSG